ncbi:MAG: hypothetical protein ACK58M_25690 [Acidobacteriota bacterium]|jgi:hypothetical protein|nr:hypothetical protein [Bryobacteraceae bacterium CoA2 C42]MCA2965965.1 hypothetical protein [Acidobacteriaceae bacterium]
MPFQLQLAAAAREITTLDSPQLLLTLSHEEDQPRLVPSPSQDGGALTILFRDAGGAPVRRVSSLLEQELRTNARVDANLALEPLAPGQPLTWTVNLAKCMWPLAAGDYTATATLAWPGETNPVASAPLAFRVQPVALDDLTVDRDNPILDRLDLLLSAGGGHLWLRQLNPSKPLGAWYNEALPALPGTSNHFCAAAAFRQVESFAPAMHRWLVWQNGALLQAALFEEGRPTSDSRRGQLPVGRQLLRQGFYTAGNQLYVLFWYAAAGRLECCELAAAGLRPVAAWPLPVSDPGLLVVRCLDGTLHIAGPHEGLTRWTADLSGRILASTRIHASPLPLRAVALQPEFDRCTALFSAAEAPATVEMVQLDPRYQPEPFVSRRELSLPGPFPELAMDADRQGRFHLLITTLSRELYYCGPGAEPRLLAAGQERYFPSVLAPGQVYLGFYELTAGFRFRQFAASADPPGFLEYRNL